MVVIIPRGYDQIIIISPEKEVLKRARNLVAQTFSEEETGKILFLLPEEFFEFLEAREVTGEEKVIAGYKVETSYRHLSEEEKEARKKTISQTIVSSLKRLKKEK